ncbi:MAG: hypothetical protein QOF16_235 [Actinomycetota bacterium]|jgi:hypothetical protein|nr:hypothetical protein [Actinomycetota bacterium]MEA2486581.1 hypothetical protein [Actinomycetota bacterium]
MKKVSIVERGQDEWRWVFSDIDLHTELESNLTYDSFYAAARAASVAYPGVPISAAEGSTPPRGWSKLSHPGARGKPGLAQKIGSLLAPVVVLLAWRRSRR